MSEDDDIRGKLRRAADDLLLRHGEEPAHPRARRPPFLRVAAVAVPVVAVLAAAGLLAAQFIGTERPGSFFDPGAVETASSVPGPAPSPTVTPTSSPYPGLVPPQRQGQPILAGRPCQPTPRTDAPSGIEVVIEANAGWVARSGGEISFEIRMRNRGRQPVSNTRSGQEYDILVRNGDGEVWLWSHDRAFGFPYVSETYAPGEERAFIEDWDLRANCGGAPAGFPPPGRYEAFGIWITQTERGSSATASREGWWSEPVAFEIR